MVLPCGDGTATDPVNHTLYNWNSDDLLDVSDVIGLFYYLFLNGSSHPLGPECRTIGTCPDVCTGRGGTVRPWPIGATYLASSAKMPGMWLSDRTRGGIFSAVRS